ncbi:metallophosphoesterase [Nostoc sp. FACHB-87]|uniref:metallophosphoesterase family protein n=1 Tax=Nostocaceae TaxID=1162 RepID=UPI0016844802|nr:MULTISPECIES: metallophosphoesterase [Nostocaceae]MBD2457077.1 metallophosphoesterase [Nostoc sp. FACHB-87]MBD2478263.1 metallophosphoesterase [Anabaena sp. FACHB-83]
MTSNIDNIQLRLSVESAQIMNEITQNLGLSSPSITLYAFHLRNSINQGEEPTLVEAPHLWEQLVDLGNKLHIIELQTLKQKLICYQDNQYFPQAEDSLGVEYSNLLHNQEQSLNFQLIPQTGGLELQGLLCPFRLHDSYAIDLTLYSQDTFSIPQLSNLNSKNLLLPPQIQASLGKTLLLFGQPIEAQDNYQDLANAFVAQILSERNSTELVGTGYLLGNPIFEYESTHTDPAKKLHILVWFKCQDMNQNHMDKVAEILLYLLWCRHKIQYVYHQSRWCDARAKQLYSKLEEYRRRFSKISQATNRQWQLRPLQAELRQEILDYSRYLEDIKDHENTIAINEQNYRAKLEKLQILPETNLDLWQIFLQYTENKLQKQIQTDLRFLERGRDRLQHLKVILQETIATEPVNDDMPGIPPEIYSRLRNALLNCDQFDTAQRLRNFFKANAPLTPWQSHWQTGSPSELVEDAIGYLNDKFRDDTKENALVILLRLLANSIDPADDRHQILAELAEELNVVLSRHISNQAFKPVNIPPEINTGGQNSLGNQIKQNLKCSFSWLHLTDLHQGMREQHWLWPGVREIFFADLKRLHDKCGPWDLVLFTGDLTQLGSAQEFEKLDQLMKELWDFFDKLGSSPKLLAVPGNHDLVRPNKKDPAVRLLQQWLNLPDIQEEFWEDAESPYRQVVTKAFENYIIWWENQTFKPKDLKLGTLPGDFSATIEKEGAKLGIVGLNTSFLQLTGDNYEGKLALHPRQFHQACNGDGSAWTKQHNACLLLTHHPPGWLNPNSQRDLKAEITSHGRFAVHLCGHLHEAFSGEIVEGGADARRIWQGRSLFGLEYYSRENTEVQRLHGYTVGKIEVSKNKGNLIFWPREARLQGGQRSIVPDYSLVLTDNQHTEPKEFELLQPYASRNM